MFSYSDIIKQAYLITKRHPLLWLFGMFLIGVFNLNFFLSQITPRQLGSRIDAATLAAYFTHHPAQLATISLSILWLSLGSLLLTNWSKILLLLSTQSLLDKRAVNLSEQVKQSKSMLWPVIKMSFLTSLFILGALLVLIAPMWIDIDVPVLQNMLWILAAIIFLPLAFTISCLNIFTGMYIVLFRLPLAKALNAATDFFASHWSETLGLGLILGVIYLAGFALGSGLLELAKEAAKIIALSFNQMGVLHVSPFFIIIKSLAGFGLWVLLGILNAFVNIALLLFFLQKVRAVPTEENERVKITQPNPAAV